MSGGLLYILRPILNLMPTVQKPQIENKFNEKMVWTGVVLFIYLLCCQIPLYGVIQTTGSDPLYWMRVILASNRGTLMELGISPLITSNMVMEVLVNAKVIQFDSKIPEDKRLLKCAEKSNRINSSQSQILIEKNSQRKFFLNFFFNFSKIFFKCFQLLLLSLQPWLTCGQECTETWIKSEF